MMRQWAILNALPKRPPGITAQALQGKLADLGFNVTQRTIQRDLNDLFRLFQFKCNEKGKPFGWYWEPGTSVSVPGLSIAEALSLHLIRDYLKPLLPNAILSSIQPQFQQAEETLKTLQSTNPFARWQDKVCYVAPSLNMLPPAINEAVLDTVQTGLLKDRQLEIAYQGIYDQNSRVLTLHPLGMIQRGAVNYLVATAFQYQDVRLYALHRIQSANILEASINRPEAFSLQEYATQGALEFGGGGKIGLKAQINKTLAEYLRETPLAEDQQLNAEGDGYLLAGSVTDSWQLRWWIMSQGPNIVIHEPLNLRNEIAEQIKAAANNYGS
jgi:predicted DNA-binding transcriptional regulator YafY